MQRGPLANGASPRRAPQVAGTPRTRLWDRWLVGVAWEPRRRCPGSAPCAMSVLTGRPPRPRRSTGRAARRCPDLAGEPEPRAFGSARYRSVAATRGLRPGPRAAGRARALGLRSPGPGGGVRRRRWFGLSRCSWQRSATPACCAIDFGPGPSKAHNLRPAGTRDDRLARPFHARSIRPLQPCDWPIAAPWRADRVSRYAAGRSSAGRSRSCRHQMSWHTRWNRSVSPVGRSPWTSRSSVEISSSQASHRLPLPGPIRVLTKGSRGSAPEASFARRVSRKSLTPIEILRAATASLR